MLTVSGEGRMSTRTTACLLSIVFLVSISGPAYSDIGVPLWTQTIDGAALGGGGNNGHDYGRGVAFDSQGNVVVAGSIDWLTNYSSAAYVVKYAPDGTFLWDDHVSYGPKTNPNDANQGVGASFNDVAIDSAGNIIPAGWIGGHWTETYVAGYYVRKYDPDGAVLTEKQWRDYTSAWQYITAAAVDAGDNVYLTGYELGDWGSIEYQWSTFKFDPFGFELADRLWDPPIRFNYNSNYHLRDHSYDLDVDADGNVIVVGIIGISGTEGSSTLNFDWRVRKYAPDKTLLWEDTYSGPSHLYDYPLGVAFDSNGDALVVGYTNKGTDNSGNADYDWLMIKYDGDTGARLWPEVTYESAAGRSEYCRKVIVDEDDNFYVGGCVRDANDVLHMRLAHIDGATGLTLEEKCWGGNAFSEILNLALQDGRLAVTGYIDNGSNYDIITTVLATEFAVQITEPAGDSFFQQGDTIAFTASPVGGTEPYTYTWSSDRDGFLGSGPTLEISTLSLGTHTITVILQDGGGQTADLNVTVHVLTLPLISDIPNATISNIGVYTGPTPQVTPGSGTVTFSLIDGPAGMTIDPATGVVTWASPDIALSPAEVTIQAQNGVGLDQESWTLTVIEPSVAEQNAISLDPAEWRMIGTSYAGVLTQIPEGGLRVTCNSYRGYISYGSPQLYNFQGSVVRYKWRMYCGGQYAWTQDAVYPYSKMATQNLTTHHSWASSIVISSNVWIYTELRFNEDRTWTSDYSYTGYGQGGINHNSGAITDAAWDLLANSYLYKYMGDGYANSFYYEIAEAYYITPGIDLEITSPAEDPTYAEPGQSIHFEAEASGGAEPYLFSWESDIDGLLGTGNSIPIDSLSLGTHRITCVCADNAGKTGIRSTIVYVIEPPVIEPIADHVTTQGVLYTGPRPGINAGALPVTWTLPEGPAGMTINGNTGVVSWSDPNALDSPYTITIQAANPMGSDTESWQLDVFALPEIGSIDDETVVEGAAYTGPLPQLLAGITPVTWSLVSGPVDMTIDPSTGQVAWPAATASLTPFMITIRAENSAGTDEESWLLTVFSSPVIAPISDVSIGEGIAYASPEMTLLKGVPAPAWDLVTAPGGMTIDPATGAVTWPSPASVGSPHTVTVRATNSQGSDEAGFAVEVIQPPLIDSVNDSQVIEGTTYTQQCTLLQGTGAIQWSLPSAPAGMTISPSGLITWAGVPALPGPQPITARAENIAGSDEVTWQVTVLILPQIADVADVSIVEGTDYTGPAPVLTKGTLPVAWSLVSGPAGMTIDPASGVVSWAGSISDGTPYTITIRAENTAGTDDESWLLHVVRPPVVAAIADAIAGAGSAYTGPVPSLADGTLPVTWTLLEGPIGMTINPVSGQVSWPVVSAVGRPHTITIQAENIAGADAESWQLDVVIPPVITDITDGSILENLAYTGPTPSLQAGDPPVAWSLVQGPAGMTIDPASGVVSWPGAIFSFTPYTITIRASNFAGSSDESWALTVLSPPVINPISDNTVAEAVAYTGPQPVLQKGSSPIAWSLVDEPTGMTIDSSTGVVNWPNPVTAGSPHLITINAQNAIGDDKQSWMLTVVSAPAIEEIADSTIHDEAAYAGPMPVLNAEAGTCTWSLVEGPAGMTINSASGVVSWASPVETGSPHTVTIRANNVAGADTESWQITVVSIPAIAPIADENIIDGSGAYAGPLPTLLKGTPPIAWSLSAAPAGMTIDPASGAVSWPVPTAAGSPHQITITASNAAGSDTETWLLRVIRVPIIADIPDKTVVENTAYYSPAPVLIQGAPADQWLLMEGPAGMTINPSTGRVQWNPVSAAGSPHPVTIRAQNLAGSDEESWQLSVISKPEIAAIPDDTADENMAYSGPLPTLVKGTAPIGWSLLSGPAGMTIDPSTGLVSWPEPTAVGSPHTVTIRATNIGGTDSETWAVEVLPSYRAAVQANVETAPAGTAVILSGYAQLIDGSGPAPDAEVAIHLDLKGTGRTFTATSGADGYFQYVFTPLASEAGIYAVSADHPSIEFETAEDEFTLVGLGANPAGISKSILAGGTTSGLIELTNLGDSDLTGLTAAVSGLPANIIVDVNSIPDLTALASTIIGYDLTALDASVRNASSAIIISSAEGAVCEIPLAVSVRTTRPELVANTTKLQSGMVRGQKTLVQFTITNKGSAATSPLQVYLPNVPWMSTAPMQLQPLGPGKSSTVVLSLTPSATLELGPYTGTIVIAGNLTGVTIPFEFISISDAIGGLLVEAVDELTYYAAGAPKISNARVRITDIATGTVTAQGLTDADGQFLAADLPEAYYDVWVRAEDHGDYRATVRVRPGLTKIISAFLEKQLVKYTWTVVPTEIEDRYEFVLDVHFETDVPVPVVTIEPAVFDLEQLEGEFTQVNYTITNHGLLAARSAKFLFDDHPVYEITPLVEDLGDIPAKSSIVVPVIIRDKTYSDLQTAAAMAEDYISTTDEFIAPQDQSDYCKSSIKGGTTYKIICGKDDRLKFVPVRFEYIDWWDCHYPPPDDPTPPGPPGPPGGGDDDDEDILEWISKPCPGCGDDDGDISGGGGGGFGGEPDIKPYVPTKPGIYTPPSKELGIPCSECGLSIAKSLAGCLWSFVPLGTAGDILNLAMLAHDCFNNPSTSPTDCVNNILAQARDVLIDSFGDTVGTLWKVAQCVYDLGGTIYSHCIYSSPQIDQAITRLEDMVGMGDEELDIAILQLIVQLERLQAQMEALTEIFGDDIWLAVEEGEGDLFTGWMEQFDLACDPGSDDGRRISPDEWTALLALPRPSQLEDADVEKMLARWNRTLDYADAGIYTFADVPEGQSTDFIAADVLETKMTAAAEAAQANIDDGYTGILDGIFVAVEDLEAALDENPQAICAKVSVQVKQEAVITRTGFEARLGIENGAADVMEEIAVAIQIEDESGADANDLFVILPPEVTGIGDVDGTGSLAPGASGSAEWLIIPTSDAAPLEATRYYVGGQFSYRLNGDLVTVPLFPDDILVQPDSRLQVKYFHQRDVFGDDPFTEEIEPVEPFALGLMMSNVGAGAAKNVHMISAQPVITENEKGLLVDFEIIGTKIGPYDATPSLEVYLGNIDPNETVVAQWLMTSSLSGRFSDYQATYRHVDGLGDPRLSLIDSVSIHELIHVVKAQVPSDDNIPDFLVNDIPDANVLPETLYLSNGSVMPVTGVTNAVADAPVSFEDPVVELTVPMVPGYAYVRIHDPGNGNYRLSAVLRSDGTALPAENFWLTNRLIWEDDVSHREKFLHLFDHDPAGPYTLYFTESVPTGSLQINIEPAEAAMAGAQWTVDDGGYWYDSGQVVPGLSVGAHTIQFTDVPGYITPPAGQVLIEAGQTALAGAVYVPSTAAVGSLRVDLGPEGAVTAGALWRLDDNETWLTSGQVINGIPAGLHTITYASVNGWIPPAAETVEVFTGQTLLWNALYTLPQYTLTAEVVGGHGSVLPVSGTFDAGTVVPLAAVAEAGYRVHEWTGTVMVPGSGSVTNTVVMDDDKTVTVEFEAIGPDAVVYNLTVLVEGNGSVQPAGGTFDPNTIVMLTAIPDAGWQVASWTNADNVPSAGSELNTVTMNTGKTVTVRFEPVPPPAFELMVAVQGQGTVTPAGGMYEEGTVLDLLAQPETGWHFAHWLGDVSGTDASITVTMDADIHVTAVFQEDAAGIAPVGQIDSILPALASPPGDTIQFSGTGTDVDGTAVAWQWTSDIDGLLGDQEDIEVSAYAMTVGIHQITFIVTDDDDMTSFPAAASVEVKNALPSSAISDLPADPVLPGQEIVITLEGFDNDETGLSIAAGQLMINGALADTPLPGAYILTVPFTSQNQISLAYRVRDDEGTWSPQATETLMIQSTTIPDAVLSAIEPDNGPVGSYVKIEGMNMGALPGSVLFDGIQSDEIVSWADDEIICAVPLAIEDSNDVPVILHRSDARPSENQLVFAVTEPDVLHVDFLNTSRMENGTQARPFSEIQRGLRSAGQHTTVIVRPGVYAEDIFFDGKNVTLTGTSPEDSSIVAQTIIHGTSLRPVVTFAGTEDPNCLLTGFTITGGGGCEETGYAGGGICGGTALLRTQATIRQCVIAENGAGCDFGGAAAYVDGLMANCIIRHNTAGQYGGGLYQCSGPVENCTIVFNTAGQYGGAMANCSGPVRNTIFHGNLAGAGANQDHLCSAPIYSCLQTDIAAEGNFAADPYFVDPNNHDFHLLPFSPCVDAGDPASDYSREPHPNGERINIGAYGNTPEAASKGGLVLTSYHYTGSTRIGRTLFDYEYSMALSNGLDMDLFNVRVKILSSSGSVVVIDPNVTFGHIPAHSVVESGDTFTLRIDTLIPVDASQITWQAEFDWLTPAQQSWFENQDTICLNPIAGDFDCSGSIDTPDLMTFARNWLRDNCLEVSCEGTDMAPSPYGDGSVDLSDFMEFAEQWTGY